MTKTFAAPLGTLFVFALELGDVSEFDACSSTEQVSARYEARQRCIAKRNDTRQDWSWVIFKKSPYNIGGQEVWNACMCSRNSPWRSLHDDEDLPEISIEKE